MRPTRLAVLTATAALLGACAASSGIRSEGGDVFTLRSDSPSGSRAVERGLADARDFCVANGRQLVVQDSRIGSGSYQLQFRCVAPFGVARAGGADPLLAAAASPVAAAPAVRGQTPRRRHIRRAVASAEAPAADPAAVPAETPRPARRLRRARPAEAAYVPPPAESAPLQPIPQATLPARFARPEPALQQPALPPVATTPLFNPGGTSLPAATAAPARRIPADSGPFTPLQPAAAAQPAAAPRAAASDALPPIQLAPAGGYGASVPSPQALPGASTALPPIAATSTTARPLPAAAPAASLNTPPIGFFTAPGR